MILMGNEFLGVGKVLLTIELHIFFPLEKKPALCDKMRKIVYSNSFFNPLMSGGNKKITHT